MPVYNQCRKLTGKYSTCRVAFRLPTKQSTWLVEHIRVKTFCTDNTHFFLHAACPACRRAALCRARRPATLGVECIQGSHPTPQLSGGRAGGQALRGKGRAVRSKAPAASATCCAPADPGVCNPLGSGARRACICIRGLGRRGPEGQPDSSPRWNTRLETWKWKEAQTACRSLVNMAATPYTLHGPAAMLTTAIGRSSRLFPLSGLYRIRRPHLPLPATSRAASPPAPPSPGSRNTDSQAGRQAGG